MEKKKLLNPKEDRDRDDRINKKLALFKHKDLQTECILRGMPFEDVVRLDHHGLANYFYKNFEVDTLDASILDEYDKWRDIQLEARGYKKGDAVFSPSLRFGFTPPMEGVYVKNNFKVVATGRVAHKEPNIKDVDKVPKRTIDQETGVYTGTKKNLTYQLTHKGLPIDEIIKKVREQFPGALDKSITIWYKRALKSKEDE